MRYICIIVTMLVFMGVAQSLQAAIFTVYNKSEFSLMLYPVWYKPREQVRIDPGGKKTFNSGLHQVYGIRWQQIDPHVDPQQEPVYVEEVFEVTKKQKDAPYNKVFLGRLNLGAKFKIGNNGYYYYKFGVDGRGEGTAVCVDEFPNKGVCFGFHPIHGIQWMQQDPNEPITSGPITYDQVFRVKAQHEKASYDKFFLSKLNLGARFEIKNNGVCRYRFGIDGTGFGQVSLVLRNFLD